jgi:ATPase family associated with various cellular activities (AAA)/Winged helix domain, variant
MFWQGIIRILQADDRMDVLLCASAHELAARSANASVDVAIVPWARSADGYPWLDRLGQPRCRAVIGVDDTTNEAVLWLRQMDRGTLLDLSQRLSGLPAGGEQDPVPVVRVRRAKVDGSSPDEAWSRDLLAWVELVVRARLSEQPYEPASGAGHIPGWTAGLEQVCELIGARPGESAVAVRVALQEFEQRFAGRGLVALGDGLPLSELEQRILGLALAPELDGRFHCVYGYLHNDLSRGYASATLLADLLRGPSVDALAIRRAVFAEGPIARLQLLEAEPGADGRRGPESALRVPLDLIEFLTRGRIGERALAPALRLAIDAAAPVPDAGAGAALLAALAQGPQPQLVQLIGPRPAGDWAAALLSGVGRRALRVDLARLDVGHAEALERFAAKVARIAQLTTTTPIVEGARQGGQLVHDLAAQLLQRLDLVVIDLKQPWTPPAGMASRLVEPFAGATRMTAAAWRAAARAHKIEISEADAVELAATRRDDPALVASICRHAAVGAAAGATIDLASLRTAAAALAAPRDTGLVRRIRPGFTWKDIVLRPDRLALLREIPTHVRHAARVMDEWGYAARLPYGQGVAAMFAGASGTGKTMAAQIIAADLGVEVFQVDLAKTVSKYIGETEKHLDQAFEDAERASAVLLFDEADALFGKRTEVKDAHDRYANVEVAYLLQRLEQFQGLVILTTNFKQNVDAAFVRRLRFSIDFPLPDAEERLKIWQGAFPERVPRAPDVDLAFLARRFQLTGGHIQQIALSAAFLAATGCRIEMRHVVLATRQQLTKLGMVSAEKGLVESVKVHGVSSA